MNTEALLIALAGVVGIFVGWTGRDALDMLRSPRKERRPMDRSLVGRRVMVALFAVMLVANGSTGALLIATRHADAQYTECVAHWQQEWAVAYKARYTPAVEVSAAMDAVVKAVADKDSAAFQKAVDNYQALRADQNHSRTSNPLPPLPNTVCGPPGEATQ